MPSLHELQSGFGRALLEGDAAAVRDFIIERGIDASDRLGIYRNNVRENLVAALEAGFPVLLRLAGEAWFRQMAIAYQRACPSSCGNLHYSGLQLAGFLEQRLGGTDYAYFADVARLEWLCQESAVAAEEGPLALHRLASVAPEQVPKLQLGLHPAVRLLESPYPVMRIWQANQPGSAAEQEIDLSSGRDRVLIRSTDGRIELRHLAAGDFAFLDALRMGRTVTDACAGAVAADPGFALAERLRLWVSLNVISRFSLPSFIR